MTKQQVFIIGATGRTGSSIVDGLLELGAFTVIAGVRPSSASKPEVEALEPRGVEVRILDLDNWSIDQVAEVLKDSDTVISTIDYEGLAKQRQLADASKKAGVKRFIPCDWATACVRGVRGLHDQKLDIHDYVKKIGLGYTFIDVGWWMEITPPFTEYLNVPFPKLFTSRVGSGDVKSAVTDRRDIGKFVARIIADERTLNRYVFCWAQEVTQNEAFAIAEAVTGRKFSTESVSPDEVIKAIKEAQANMIKAGSEYAYSIWVRGDNTVENAKKGEYGSALDARELYPEIGKELRTLEDLAKDLASS